MSRNKEKVLISIHPELLKETDAFAKGRYMSRSELIRQALLAYMHPQQQQSKAYALVEEAATDA